ncbi:bifunctional riboflavin kinase/FAD synthetase [Pontivivens insulae]|uniref:Riboflavin biosynthesis protein n=1 Tax=Pontivivens insulae TaxID=1639689 RepID=A0A2R8A8D9_9RHOB|nr:bifunctional riboflavin kinase/FAD synthetase [Pontivivens insulae]RED18584.1 FMN adenylyltransferase /riboflavin kinase [Pontivivens insulae]SPF28482.1 Riboflavin biosynthesis protein RibF [Pontivivens insulae]
MQVHHSVSVPDDARGASVAMGNFDGLHLGHQSVLDLARRADAPLGVVTFEPHPRQVFAPDAPPFRLMNATARANRLAKLGVDQLYEVPFDAALAGLTPEAFINDVLIGGLGISHLVVGADFRFGKGRAGDVETLARAPFDLTVAPLLEADGVEISSTAIRMALSEGRPQDAASMLGHLHRIEGVVEHGFKRGREMGFPTANLSMAGLHLPAFGVYACRADVLTGPHKGSYDAVASLGSRPTFGDNAPNLEVMLLDFDGDLYDAEMSVALIEFQRPELKYEGMEPLIAQMHKDLDKARIILAAR